MEKKIKKFFARIADAFDLIFKGPASNQLRISKTQPGKFKSYSQLKKYQRHFRKVSLEVFLAATFLFIGILFGPVVFQEQFQSEIYIPDGKGDIVIGNVSKNQATVIFKTLDLRNDNKPLATSAMVEVYLDPDFTQPFKRTEVFEYAVTHMIPINGLQEGRNYYFKVVASESEDMSDPREVTRWAGKEPISVYTSGDIISECAVAQNASRPAKVQQVQEKEKIPEDSGQEIIFAPSIEEAQPENGQAQDFSVGQHLAIGTVQNENYLHGKEKVQTIISWETNIPSNSSLLYRSDREGNENEFPGSRSMETKHQITLTILKPETTYYFKVKSISENGEVAVSSEYSMRTPRPKETVLEMVGNNFKAIFK